MKNLRYLPFAIIIGAAIFIIYSCSYTPNGPSAPTAKIDFHTSFHGNYDIFVVDTADANGNNPDHILDTSKVTVQDIVSDTALTFAGKYPVVKIKTYQIINQSTPGALLDSTYFYQDPNGDLYRYNFGFSILNQFSALTQAIGSNVDVGWVLAAKMTSSSGTTWLAKQAYDTIQSFNLQISLTSNGTMMSDTSFQIGTQSIKVRHARNVLSATTAGNLETGTVILDSYYSTDINGVVCDFFRHVKLSGSLITQQAQGRFKIMTSFTP